MYDLVVLQSASRQLNKFDKPVRTKVIAVLEKIAENSRGLGQNVFKESAAY